MARTPKSSKTAPSSKSAKQIDALQHETATRRNIPTAEMESFFRRDEDQAPMPPQPYPRARPLAEGATRTAEEPRQPELIWNGARITITEAQMKELAETGRLTLSDAQLVWRGKDRQDWTDLVVNVPPLYIQEKIHPKAIIDGLRRYREGREREGREQGGEGTGSREQGTGSREQGAGSREQGAPFQPDLFADFNGLKPDQRAECYHHDQHWSNRMILGDSLQVMASLAERESLRGKVQCIYFDPPYGIKFNSNWQVSTQSRDVKDGKQTEISREPEQVMAFRDTWKDGIHSYLAYLRDRLTVMRDLLTESGSIFVQIGDENVHRVRAVMDEVFGAENLVSQITFKVTTNLISSTLGRDSDFILWYCCNIKTIKYRQMYKFRSLDDDTGGRYSRVQMSDGRRIAISDSGSTLRELDDTGAAIYRHDNLTSQGATSSGTLNFLYQGHKFSPGQSRHWTTNLDGLRRLGEADRLARISHTHPSFWLGRIGVGFMQSMRARLATR